MTDATRCEVCGRTLTQNDVGIHKRLVNRGAVTFRCRHCLAVDFDCDVARIDAQIRRFRATGCQLFAPLPVGYEWSPWQLSLREALAAHGIEKPVDNWPDELLPALTEGFAVGLYETVGVHFGGIAAKAEGLPAELPQLVAARYAALTGIEKPVDGAGRRITLCAASTAPDTLSLFGGVRNAYCLIPEVKEDAQ